MFVILQENIKKLGIKGAVVKVKGGYGRNYLLPEKKAIMATKENLAELEKNKAKLEKENAKELDSAKKIAESIRDVSLSISCKANTTDGKLFGSITSRDIVKELEKLKVKISSKDVFLPQIKYIGDYVVQVMLHPEIVLKLPLLVKHIENDTKV
ncbi:MAG: 50S ribosomal protein L9 [Rickettsiaceae bacterium H1]|nr:50S ribosomal protein L9 [Rickettsiaceae bacterium H1]